MKVDENAKGMFQAIFYCKSPVFYYTYYIDLYQSGLKMARVFLSGPERQELASLALRVADEFETASADKTRQSMATLAIQMAMVGEPVSADILREHILKGPDHMMSLSKEMNSHARNIRLSYDAIAERLLIPRQIIPQQEIHTIPKRRRLKFNDAGVAADDGDFRRVCYVLKHADRMADYRHWKEDNKRMAENGTFDNYFYGPFDSIVKSFIQQVLTSILSHAIRYLNVKGFKSLYAEAQRLMLDGVAAPDARLLDMDEIGVRTCAEGRLDILVFLRPMLDLDRSTEVSGLNDRKYTPKANIFTSAAAEAGQLETLRFLHEKCGLTLEPELAKIAAENGRNEILTYLHACGIALDYDGHNAAKRAAYFGKLDTLRHIDSLCPLSPDDLHYIGKQNVTSKHSDILDYVCDRLPEPCRTASMACFLRRAVDASRAYSNRLKVIKQLFQKGACLGAIDKVDPCADPAVLIYLDQYSDELNPAMRLNLLNDEAIRSKLRILHQWIKITGAIPPKGLSDKKTYKLRAAPFDAVKAMLAKEGLQENEQGSYAYQAAALFGTEDRILRYLDKWGTISKQPLHDVLHMIQLPQQGAPDLKAWGDAILKFGPPMAALVKFADRLPRPLASYAQTRAEIGRYAFKRGQENPALGAICYEFLVDEAAFEEALAIMQQSQENDKISENIPDMAIEGDRFGMKGCRLIKLPAKDMRGLFLGEYTDCCQSIGKTGAACAKHGYTSPNGGFYVVLSPDEEIIGQSWAWRGSDGSLVLDSLETLGERVTASQWSAIVREMKTELDNRNVCNVSRLMVGTGGATLIIKNERSKKPAMPLDYHGYRDSNEQLEIGSINPSSNRPSAQRHPVLKAA